MQNDNNHKNLAAAILENGGYSTDTSLTIPTTTAATFPDVPFFATIMPTTDLANSNNSEIVEVTATSESGGDTTFTISRGQRGTTAMNWDAGKAVLVHAIYTEDVVYIDTTLSTPTNIAYVSEDNIQTGAVTTSKIANSAVTSDKIDFTTLVNSGYAYGPGSTVTMAGNSEICSGLITNSAKTAWITLIFPKPVYGATTVSITRLNGAFRGINGQYISGGSKDWANKVSEIFFAGNIATLSIDVEGETNLPTNNTPLSFFVQGGVTATFG